MRHAHHSHAGSDAAHLALAALAGWTASAPFHRILEAQAAELADVQERDAAARNAFQRRMDQ